MIRDIGTSAVRKKGEPKGVNSQMPFNAVGGFVKTKTFRLHTGIAGIFHRLGVNDDQRRESAVFFLPIHALVRVRHSSVPRIPQWLATECKCQ